jgi:hypothetical protein
MRSHTKIGRFYKTILTLALMTVVAFQGYANESGPLIDLLIRKGIITDQEAEDLRAELAADFADTSAGKIEIGSSVKQLKTKVDIRARYQWEESEKAGTDDMKSRSRWRYRVKLGADYIFANGWSSGIQLETAEASDSTNADFGGYFDKNGDGIFLGQVYIDYSNSSDWADLVNFTVGKKKQPFLISSAFWDSDINPEGFTEQLGWRLEGDSWFTLRAGEYIIDESREDKGSDVNDDWLFMGQVEYKRHLGMKSDLSIAPMFLVETEGTTSTATAEAGNTPTNENGIDYFGNFFAIAVPIEYTFLLNEKPQKLWAMFGFNLYGDDAVNEAGSPYRPSNAAAGETFDSKNRFFNIGYTYGKAKTIKDWDVSIEYRYVEAAAFSPNLNDSDFGKNTLNQAGFILSGGYMISDSVKLGATYMHSSQIDKDWISPVAGKGDVNLLQIDFNAKF